MFVGYSDHSCKAWDTTAAPGSPPVFILAEHDGNVSSVGINSSGNALCTASADMTLKVRRN
jgi:WD40 repeat protein